MRSRPTRPLRKAIGLTMIAVLTVLGCATPRQSVDIPLPRTTPFDNSPLARMTYLDAFRDGYLAARSTTHPSIQVVQSPNRFAYELGFRAGASAARESQP